MNIEDDNSNSSGSDVEDNEDCLEATELLIVRLEEEIRKAYRSIEDGMHSSEEINLEVEGRLGTVRDTVTKEQVELPLVSFAVLDPPDEAYNYVFDSGVDKKQFYDICKVINDYFRHISGTGVSDERNIIDNIYAAPDSIKHKYGMSDRDTIRISSTSGTADSKRTVIWKQRLFVINVYGGHFKKLNRVDCRFAVNLEHTIVLPDQPLHKKFERNKHRRSFIFDQYLTIDATRIDGQPSSGAGEGSHKSAKLDIKHEVEVELDSAHTTKEVVAALKGEPNHLRYILSALVSTLCNMADYLNTHSTEELKRRTNLAECAPSPEKVDTYVEKLSKVVPLVGDYLFRAVAPSISDDREPIDIHTPEYNEELTAIVRKHLELSTKPDA